MRPLVALTELIQRAQNGDTDALRQVFEAAYEDLRRMARSRLRLNGRGVG